MDDLPQSTDELLAAGDRSLARSHKLIAHLDELLVRSEQLLSEDDSPLAPTIDLRETDQSR
ncbi:MAG: hypothetical protein ACLGHT_01875 [Acidimicrobiia bacterium]